MRWDELKVESEEERTLPGYRDAAVVRRFDAPEALDIRFYEVRAKSALNQVPKASRMPFRWTVNPYRGCTHACTYCLAGDTPILMADGRSKPLADLQVGDALYGTRLDEGERRYAESRVLAHWSTTKPAYKVTLADGTELIASSDHRFLTGRGWRHVTGRAHGLGRRPHLTSRHAMVGPGREAMRAGRLRVFAARDRGAVATLERPRLAFGDAAVSAAGLEVVAVESLGVHMRLYDITTSTGDFVADGVVSHNCFARPTHTYLDMGAGRDFEREIVVKVNAPEVLRRELARPSWKGEHVALGTNTDPYQWVEGRYKLMPGIWEAFRDFANPCSVLTKSPLLLRDLPLMKQAAERAPISANLSVPTLDEKAWRATEPHTPHPRARLEAVAELNRQGIPTGVLVAPLMPGINDAPEQVEPLLQMAAEAGAVHVGGIALHLRGEVREIFFSWLRSQRPDLVPLYERLYARGAYAPKAERARLSRLVGSGPVEQRRYLRDRPALTRRPEPRLEEEVEQPSLF
jgi:DNA repair photolyase